MECVEANDRTRGEYYFFFTTVLVDAVVREQTTARWHQLLPDRGIWQAALHKGETFVFYRSRLDGKHMWVDPNMPTDGALVSDALYSALTESGIDSFYGHSGFVEA